MRDQLRKELGVKVWYPKWVFTRALASEGDSEDAPDAPILVNGFRLGAQSASGWADTVSHELSHRAGYLHFGNAETPNRCTLPYVINDVVNRLARPMAKPADKTTPSLKCEYLSGKL